mgnify:CR=1 FL=1
MDGKTHKDAHCSPAPGERSKRMTEMQRRQGRGRAEAPIPTSTHILGTADGTKHRNGSRYFKENLGREEAEAGTYLFGYLERTGLEFRQIQSSPE